jgi:3',5'-cyclic AMP phosphodiesterase CpdA
MTSDAGGVQSMSVTRGDQNTHKPPPIPARILWPALGFPAVIDPGNSSKSDDASTCVRVVIITPRSKITKKQAADHLRFALWDQRHTRYYPPGAAHGFLESEIEVRTNPQTLELGGAPQLLLYGQTDEFVQQIYFGANAKGEDGFIAALSLFVIKKYSEWGYHYVHEIIISRAGSSRLAPNQYNLFWINSNWEDTEAEISDEMDLLIKKFAVPAREEFLKSPAYLQSGDDLSMDFLFKEYEWDYDLLHPPYNQGVRQAPDPKRRTEVLHPLFVQAAADSLKIGHITDLHVSVRNDLYEFTLKNNAPSVKFNNCNTVVKTLYSHAKETCDVLLLTGDLIDYGRGHIGLPNVDRQGDDWLYHTDRQWFLFYYVLASGTSYQKPAYTILGNHDWRLNPYPPFAPGATPPEAQINNYTQFSNDELKAFIQLAHGKGHDKHWSYLYDAKGTVGLLLEQPGLAATSLWQLYNNTQTLNVPGFPTETTIESVAWYLLLINPFLDYAFHLPGGYDVLMLDWAEYEDLLFPIVENGLARPYHIWEASDKAVGPGPMAKNCLTDLQKFLVERLVAKSSKAKVLGIHAPPIGAYTEWTDDLLYSGTAKFRYTSTDGKSGDYYGPIFAINPKRAPAGVEASYNTFVQHRDWFLQKLKEKDANVRLVLAGHIHRNGLFVVHTPKADPQHSIAAEMHVYLMHPDTTSGAVPPAVIRPPQGFEAPLYVNTTSAGPRGHSFASPKNDKNEKDVFVDPGYAVIDLSSDGTIRKVAFGTAATPASVK